jgi:hypothetical protein
MEVYAGNLGGGDPIRKVEPIERIPQTNKDGDAYVPNPPGTIGAGLYKDRPAPAVQRLVHEKKALDQQVGGNHYKDFAIQPIEFIMKNNLNFCQGNVIKYVCRYAEKNGIEDLKKAIHYINLLIQLEYGDENQGIQAK